MVPSKTRKQLALALPQWGGKRDGAGRKPAGKKAGVEHLQRNRVNGSEPMHVTMRLRRLPSLRKKKTYRIVRTAIERASERDGFAVVHYSVQRDHLHLMVEAADNRSLSRGIQSLAVRVARNLNQTLRRKGPVFSDRYHLRILKTPRETQNALLYLLNNAKKHARQYGVKLSPSWVDPFSTAACFDGWLNFPEDADDYGIPPPDLPRATTWLLRSGWKRRGLLDIQHVPG